MSEPMETVIKQESEPAPVNISEESSSTAFGISIRGWLATMVLGTVCAMSIAQAAVAILKQENFMIEEPLYSLAVATLGFYFGQKTNKSL